MLLLRRYAAAVVAASALTLGACGSEAPTMAPELPTGDAVNDPLIMTLNPAALVFQSNTATAPGPQWAGAGGLVTIGSGVIFGTVVYSPAVGAWLSLNQTPSFVRDLLLFRYLVSINQAVYASLANGVYTAQIPFIVPAARNSPQMLDVVLCKGTGCLVPGGSVTSTHDGSDATWNRGSDVNATPGTYFFEDYFVLIPANSTVHITMEGNHCGQPYTHSDPYLYAFELGGTFINSDDDGLCGFNSYLPVTNNTNAGKLIRLRTTSFSGGQSGTFLLRVLTSSPFALREEPPAPTAEQAEQYRLKAETGSY